MSKYDDHRIPFAIGPDGQPASIYEVERGLACGCTCPDPGCGARLVAKQGEVQAWHFAHESNASCLRALESSMHIAVKRVIAQEMRILLPPCNVLRYPDDTRLQFSCPPSSGEYSVRPYRYTKQLWAYEGKIRRCGGGVVSIPSKNRMFEFDEILEEVSQGNIRPDLIAVIDGRRLYIEVAVTHPVDREKLLKIRARGVATVQISVPHDDALAMNMDRLRKLVVDSVSGKAWVFNPFVEDKAENDYVSKAPERDRIKAALARAAKKQAEQEAQEEQYRIEKLRVEEEQRKKDEAEAAVREAARLARVAEQSRLYAQQRAEREAAEAEKKARLLKQEKAQEEAEVAAQRALRERVRTQFPSFKYPLDKNAAVLFIDLDCLLEHGGLDLLGKNLGDRNFNIVVTSDIRKTDISNEDLCRRMRSLNGRPVRATPQIDSENRYGLRKQEIDLWCRENKTSEWMRQHLIIDSGWFKLSYPHIVMSSDGFLNSHAIQMREYLRLPSPDSDGSDL